MAKMIFTEDEYLTMAMFEADTREKVLTDLKDCLQFITNDQELTDLVKSTIGKLKRITDEDYKKMDLSPYKQEAEAE